MNKTSGMKKITIFTLLLFCTSMIALAQPEQGKFRFSIGPEIGYTAGPYAQRWNFGAGATGQFEYFIKDGVSLTAVSGFMGYLGDKAGPGIRYQAVNIIPVKGGIRFYFGDAFHVGAQLGAGFIDNGSGHTTAFAYSPIIGYTVKTSGERGGIDFSIKYDGYSFNEKDIPDGYGSTFGAVDVRIAYVF